MIELELVKIIDINGKVTGEKNKITYQALTDDELDNLYQLESDYTYIGYNFKVERIGIVEIPSLNNE